MLRDVAFLTTVSAATHRRRILRVTCSTNCCGLMRAFFFLKLLPFPGQRHSLVDVGIERQRFLLKEYVEHGSEEAFATLVARHVNKVYSIALRHTRNAHQAEEITQAVFVLLARKSRQLGKRVILSGWLCRTARLSAVTFVRSEVRRTQREQEALAQVRNAKNIGYGFKKLHGIIAPRRSLPPSRRRQSPPRDRSRFESLPDVPRRGSPAPSEARGRKLTIYNFVIDDLSEKFKLPKLLRQSPNRRS